MDEDESSHTGLLLKSNLSPASCLPAPGAPRLSPSLLLSFLRKPAQPEMLSCGVSLGPGLQHRVSFEMAVWERQLLGSLPNWKREAKP